MKHPAGEEQPLGGSLHAPGPQGAVPGAFRLQAPGAAEAVRRHPQGGRDPGSRVRPGLLAAAGGRADRSVRAGGRGRPHTRDDRVAVAGSRPRPGRIQPGRGPVRFFRSELRRGAERHGPRHDRQPGRGRGALLQSMRGGARHRAAGAAPGRDLRLQDLSGRRTSRPSRRRSSPPSQECRIFKPQSSRKASKEIYLIGKGRK